MPENWDWDAAWAKSPSTDPVVVPLNANNETSRYGKKALDDELQTLLDTPEGRRNDQLNIAAFSLAQLIPAGHINQQELEAALRSAAYRIGLDASEIPGTIRSGMRAGSQQPRQVPDWKPLNDTPATVSILATSPPTADIDIDEETPRTTWWPEPLTERAAKETNAPEPTYLQRDDGQPLLYPGKINGFIGESESGKSWIALLAVLQAIKNDHRCLYLDFEDSPAAVNERLQLMGALDHEINEYVYYANPDEALGILQKNDLRESLEHQFKLIVIDGVNAAMALDGYEINSNTDANLFRHKLLKPLASTGACVVVVDHISKNPDTRGKGGIGAQSKRAMTDGALILVEVTEPFGRGQTGTLKLTVDKDRNGRVRGASGHARHVGTATLISTPTAVRLTIAAPHTDDKPWQPTAVMEQVSRALEHTQGDPSFRGVKDLVTAREETIKAAIKALVDTGHITIKTGPNRATLHHLEKPYREKEASVSYVSPGVSPVSPGDTNGHGDVSPPPLGVSPPPKGGETPVWETPAMKTPDQDQLAVGVSHCNDCGTLVDEKTLDDTAGYCRRCGRINNP